MSESVQYTIDIPADVHERLTETASKSGLKVEELIVSASELLFKQPNQNIMKRLIRLISARAAERIIANFPAVKRNRQDKSDNA